MRAHLRNSRTTEPLRRRGGIGTPRRPEGRRPQPCALLAAALLPFALQAAPRGLTIENAGVRTFDDGPKAPADYRFRAGETVYFSFQISGYRTQSVEFDISKVHLTWTIAVQDASGVALEEPTAGTIDTTVSLEDRNWIQIERRNIVLPPFVPAGRFHILLEVRDELAKISQKADIPFLLAGYTVAPGAPLGVRNFRFHRTSEEKDALQVAAYSPGDTLWARFEIVGFQLGEGNRYSVEYGLKVLKPDGTVAFQQPDAAQAENAPFYPQRMVPGVLSLNIPKDLAKSKYTMVVTVTDRLSGRSAEGRQPFSVE